MTAVRACTLVAAVLIAGCGGDPPLRSERQATAIEWNERGQAAAARGDLAQARASFEKALEINRAIENADAVALELLNLSAIHFRLGDPARAFRALDEVLTGPMLAFLPERRAEAAYRRARFELDNAGTDAAAQSCAQALALCADRCASLGRILNLQAQLALRTGHTPEARDLARCAEALHRRQHDALEQANSSRLVGDAALAAGDYLAAQASYDAALVLDKEAGAASKVALDLIGVGRALRSQGRVAEAAVFFRRARAVAESAGDAALRAITIAAADASAP